MMMRSEFSNLNFSVSKTRYFCLRLGLSLADVLLAILIYSIRDNHQNQNQQFDNDPCHRTTPSISLSLP
jgi:hypothetical protein